MKTVQLLGVIVCCMLATSVKAQANLSDIPPKDSAYIYIYRVGQFTGSLANWAMFLNDKKICKLSNNRYIRVTVPKGKHVISSKIGGIEVFKKKTDIEIDAEANGKYFVACHIKQSITRSRLEFTEVTKSTADKQMVDMKYDNCQESIDNEKN